MERRKLVPTAEFLELQFGGVNRIARRKLIRPRAILKSSAINSSMNVSMNEGSIANQIVAKTVGEVLSRLIEVEKPRHRPSMFPKGTVPSWLKPYQFKPGVTGNPLGRPPVVKISQAYRELCAEVEPTTGLTYAQLIALATAYHAIAKGNIFAAKEIRETVEGKLPEQLTVDARIGIDINTASTDELEALVVGYQVRVKG